MCAGEEVCTVQRRLLKVEETVLSARVYCRREYSVQKMRPDPRPGAFWGRWSEEERWC